MLAIELWDDNFYRIADSVSIRTYDFRVFSSWCKRYGLLPCLKVLILIEDFDRYFTPLSRIPVLNEGETLMNLYLKRFLSSGEHSC